MAITLDEVRHVAKLARLKLDELELAQLQIELNALIGHFSDIQDIDVTMIEPDSPVATMLNVWDDDIPISDLESENVLRNAAVTRAGLFVVPTIIED